ncbi:TlpA family protein disulfide reductase [Sphingobacterium alkalisoli]|uniref:TlpA family protein disulfide reductase n=1 Tax=Sphingobacterium alkalisoli TaxID=1874115 RepID=A0A4U0GRJ4_9SPHI|nr:TlpA disulfide reductase family protein [Sphingobacterium alkalisoli]TJY61498.1 TlpA family protein disulfide reductase [Sphingobacterium alkalisoli]
MNTTFLKIFCLLLFAACTMVLSPAFAQYIPKASQQNISYQEMREHLNKLYEEKADLAVQQQLKDEADVLANHPNEALVSLAILTYGQLLGDQQKADSIRNATEEKYPLGLYAASKVYDALFQEAANATDLEEKYNAFNQKYNVSSYDEMFQPKFQEGQLMVINAYLEEGNQDRAIELVPMLKDGPFFVYGVYLLDKHVEGEDKHQALLPLAKDAYADANTILRSAADNDPMLGFYERELRTISSIYASMLYHTGDYQQASELALKLLSDTNYDNDTTPTDANTLAGAYVALDRKMDALAVYETFIRKHGIEGSMGQAIKELYLELYPTEDFERHLHALDEEATAQRMAKYEQEMLKKQAPAFTLMDRNGKAVSLADYRGKVVILDFWATWCGPCLASFPGMQAAVNKYADDSDVVFLFIDTRQNEDNYKELVEDFMTKSKYSFYVLFDEMKDPANAVVNAYGINGIPTKVVIDKEGFIRFQNAGGEPNVEKLVKELDTKIELAKRHSGS